MTVEDHNGCLPDMQKGQNNSVGNQGSLVRPLRASFCLGLGFDYLPAA